MRSSHAATACGVVFDDPNLIAESLRQAGNTVVFDRIRASSTLGYLQRAFTHGRVQQLNAMLGEVCDRTGTPGAAAARWHEGGYSWTWTSRIGRSTATPSRALRWAD